DARTNPNLVSLVGASLPQRPRMAGPENGPGWDRLSEGGQCLCLDCRPGAGPGDDGADAAADLARDSPRDCATPQPRPSGDLWRLSSGVLLDAPPERMGDRRH